MRYSFFISLLLTCFFYSCSQPQTGDSAAADSLARVQLAHQERSSALSSSAEKPKYNFTDPKFILEDHKHKFHTGYIRSFDDDLLKKDQDSHRLLDSLYPILDRESFDVFQSNEKVYDAVHDETPYYYGIQQAGQHTGIIVLQQNDAWVDEYIYMAYDRSGKLVGTAVLAGEGGDGGYGTYMTGEFINDSVFIKKTIETEHDFEKQVDNVIVNTTDEITIHYNGKITKRTIK